MSYDRVSLGAVVGPVFSPRTWLAMVYLVSGLPLAVIYFVLALVGFTLGIGLLPLALLGVPVLAFTLVLCGWFASLESGRAALMLDVHVRQPSGGSSSRGGQSSSGQSSSGQSSSGLPRRRRPPFVARVRSVLVDPSRWRELAAPIVCFPIALAGFVIAISAWSVALALVLLPAYNYDLPRRGATAFGWTLSGAPSLAIAVALGVTMALAAPHVTLAAAVGVSRSERAVLGWTRSRELEERVGNLEESRSKMVAAEDSERRRIERDLHDGAQARLVSVAMELGRAKARFSDDPEAARELVEQAHQEAKAALSELRNLVRGVHPPVLSDRGLDAALSGLAALCPVPVTVEVELSRRPPAAVEAIAYFVVSEALANVAKHSHANRASVVVRSDGQSLRVLVNDDGQGGARPDGAGLAGLADRVGAVDGRFSVDSPPGGPTTIEADLPCGS
ncbi:MAG: sensor histidine kinase [Acidimicrobiales bacterium]